MLSAQIREAFLRYFEGHGHTIVSSSPLVPANDPTLLFTNAGMVQFKDVFLGQETRGYTRATTSQRCLRAGGKHNDLDNVGYTARHHTFFEMLGNFSFGDYSKREAIQFAWSFLTEELGVPQEKLWVTVYKDDQEAEDIWLKELGVSGERFSRCREKDNFWSMGDTGPCGPCSEIFYDHGPEIAGGPPGSPDEDADRYVEIWNLVFMQYNRSSDGKLNPLPKPSVDTGMGLERMAAVLQGVHNNYDIDLFQSLINKAAQVIGVSDKSSASLRVIADHIRACSFMIVDGVRVSNEGRGYVVRRIIRRAVRHGHKLGASDEPFFYRLVEPLVAEMSAAYPELAAMQQVVEQLLRQEEAQFNQTLNLGLKVLEVELAKLHGFQIPGEVVFKLYDTYGFPVDLTADIARERQLTIDEAGFEQAMAVQRDKSRAGSQFAIDYNDDIKLEGQSEFTGYESLTGESSIEQLFAKNKPVMILAEGEQGTVVLESTPFYAESGGQVGDTGVIESQTATFKVLDTTKKGDVWLHHGVVERGQLAIGKRVTVTVDGERRQAIRLNHSATHLLHAALRQVLGEHVVQKGSLVNAEKLRFDFTHAQALTAAQKEELERIVNAKIQQNSIIQTRIMNIEQAKVAGAMALFGEKYSDMVRVLNMGGDFSVELCGGTHAARTGDIGLFKFTLETAIAAGVRRVEAVTGLGALQWMHEQERLFVNLEQVLKTGRQDLPAKAAALLQNQKATEKELAKLKQQAAAKSGTALKDKVKEFGDVKVVVAELKGYDAKALRGAVDSLKDSLGDKAVVCLGSGNGSKVNFVAGVSKGCVDKIKAGVMVNVAAAAVGGKGGGRDDMAQAGGTKPEGMQQALANVRRWVAEQLG